MSWPSSATKGAFAPDEDRCQTVERNGGRTERRLSTVLGGRRQRTVCYDISSRHPDAAALLELARGHWRGPSGRGNGRHRTLDVPCREDDGRMRKGHAPAVMGILRRTALNRVCTIQGNLGTDVSIGLLRDRIGHQPWILAAVLP